MGPAQDMDTMHEWGIFLSPDATFNPRNYIIHVHT